MMGREQTIRSGKEAGHVVSSIVGGTDSYEFFGGVHGAYRGGTRRVRLLTGTGVWYNRTHVVPIRWVYVVDRQGTHRDDCVFSTDVTLSPRRCCAWRRACSDCSA